MKHCLPCLVCLVFAVSCGVETAEATIESPGGGEEPQVDGLGEADSALIGDLHYIQAEAMEQRTAATQVYAGSNASGGYGRALYNVHSRIRGYIYLPTRGCRRVRVAAWASQCGSGPWPVLGLGIYPAADPNAPGKGYINGVDGRTNPDGSYFQWYMGTHFLQAGWNEVYLDFRNYDAYEPGRCDQNLYLDYMAFRDVGGDC